MTAYIALVAAIVAMACVVALAIALRDLNDKVEWMIDQQRLRLAWEQQKEQWRREEWDD